MMSSRSRPPEDKRLPPPGEGNGLGDLLHSLLELGRALQGVQVLPTAGVVGHLDVKVRRNPLWPQGVIDGCVLHGAEALLLVRQTVPKRESVVIRSCQGNRYSRDVDRPSEEIRGMMKGEDAIEPRRRIHSMVRVV